MLLDLGVWLTPKEFTLPAKETGFLVVLFPTATPPKELATFCLNKSVEFCLLRFELT